MIEGGVGAGVARAQPKRQRLAGVVTPRGQRVMTPGALECARGLLFVAVRDLDRGVHADHDRLPQVAVGHPRGRDPSVPGLDQPPHVPADLALARPRSVPAGPGRSRPAPATASGPRPPARTARPDPAAPPDPTAPGRRRRSAPRCRPAPGPRSCTGVNPRRRNALRQRAGQPGPVGQQPQRRGPGVRHDPVPADFHGQIPRPRGKLIHLKGAPRSRQNVGFDTLILPGQGHLSPFRHAPRQDRYELSGPATSRRTANS